MNNLSIKDRVILLAVALCIFVYIGYCYLWIPVNAAIKKLTVQETELKGQLGDQTPLDSKIQQLEKDNGTLVKQIADIKASHGNRTLNKHDFLIFLGNECNNEGIELVRFNDLESQEVSGVWKVQFDFELRGSLSSLNKVCGAIDGIGVKYSVGGMSLRQNNNYSYLERFFDDNSKLEWYKDETPMPEEETVQTIPDETPEPYDESWLIPHMAEYMPEPEMPNPTPEPTPTPMPEEPQEESITDRLNRLLDISAYSSMKDDYKFMFLANVSEVGEETDLPVSSITSDEIMKLNITIEFIMYTNPKDSINSITVISPEV